MDENTSDLTRIGFSDHTKRDAFLTAEFNALRREIESHIVERRKIESQTFIGLAAIYAWVLTRTPPLDPIYMKSALGLTVVFSILGFVRWAAMMLRVMTIGGYIKEMEGRFLAEGEGWETALNLHRSQHPIRNRLEGWAEALSWAIAVLGTVGAFVYALIAL